MIETSAPLSTGETLEVELPDAGTITARVIWQRETYFGCEFLTRAPVAAVSAALLRSAPRRNDIPLATTAPAWEADRHAPPRPRPQPVNQGLMMFVLILLLIAAPSC